MLENGKRKITGKFIKVNEPSEFIKQKFLENEMPDKEIFNQIFKDKNTNNIEIINKEDIVKNTEISKNTFNTSGINIIDLTPINTKINKIFKYIDDNNSKYTEELKNIQIYNIKKTKEITERFNNLINKNDLLSINTKINNIFKYINKNNNYNKNLKNDFDNLSKNINNEIQQININNQLYTTEEIKEIDKKINEKIIDKNIIINLKERIEEVYREIFKQLNLRKL